MYIWTMTWEENHTGVVLIMSKTEFLGPEDKLKHKRPQ